MEIIKKSDMLFHLKKVVKERYGHLYMINPTGRLTINCTDVSYGFLVYQNGHWYGGKYNRVESSDKTGEHGKILFGLSEKRFCMMKNDGAAEFSPLTQDLGEDARVFLFAEQEDGLYLTIVDGRKLSDPFVLVERKDVSIADTLAYIVISLVRQYDPEAADQMEAFWFVEGATPLTEEKNQDCEDKEAYIEGKDDLPWY